MADYPVEKLGGKTPLQCAFTPFMDQIAAEGTLGLVDTIPEGLVPGSDVATLSVLGYDPRETYSGRGPLEAASMGINLGPNDVVYRCNLVTIGDKDSPGAFMDDFTSGHITSEESREIILDINKEIGRPPYQFFPGVGYPAFVCLARCSFCSGNNSAHDITGKQIAEYLPRGNSAEEINSIMRRASEILKNHPVNVRRLEAGKKQANSIWLWGQGKKPQLVPLNSKIFHSGRDDFSG